MKRRLTIDKVWKVFSPFIKEILEDVYGNKCITCNKPDLIGQDRQLGHFRPKKAYPRVRWWIVNLGIQCSRCNGWKQGAPYEFSEWIKKTHGEAVFQEVIFLSHQSFNNNQLTYQMILEGIQYYKKQIKDKKMTRKEVYNDIINTKFGLEYR